MQHGHTEHDLAAMRAALTLAARGPVANPNPRVGAVVVDRSGQTAGAGFHAGAGTPHAEVVALDEAGDAALGGTAYVTLEPCSHTGRTGPCSEALVAAGVTRVVFAQTDPDPRAGGGADRLRAAGVEVVAGLLEGDAESLNRSWTFAVTHGRPMVTWKIATTLDGRSAAADGTSRWITGETAQADVHDLRAACDAILVGTGTALADDPSLTARHPDGSLRAATPLRVVMGRRDLPPSAQVLDGSSPSVQLRTHDPTVALAALWDKDIRHVLLEGGPTLAAAFVRAGLLDEVVAYVAPALLGSGPNSVGDLGITTIADALRLDIQDVTAVGPDLRIRATLCAPVSTAATTTTTTDTPTAATTVTADGPDQSAPNASPSSKELPA